VLGIIVVEGEFLEVAKCCCIFNNGIGCSAIDVVLGQNRVSIPLEGEVVLFAMYNFSLELYNACLFIWGFNSQCDVHIVAVV